MRTANPWLDGESIRYVDELVSHAVGIFVQAVWFDCVDPLRLLASLLEMWDVPKGGRCTG